ncbi:MAG: 16S rRNA (cytosine(1402)-N(4))-methyltransferase RsmH [Patescibacteria group bacterium]
MSTQKGPTKIDDEGFMTPHVPVLLHETIDLLALQPGAVVLDGTVGAGGHAEEIARRIGKTGTLICLDQDSDALARASLRLSTCAAKTHFLHTNFRNIPAALDSLSIANVDAIVLDVGISSMHLESSGRGFTFQRDEPLLMTMAYPISEGVETARDIVNRAREEDLADIFWKYGEERFSRRIARAIVEARKRSPIETSGTLAEIVTRAMPRRGKRHPATRVFQALRIVVNDELGALSEGIAGGISRLSRGGRIAIISFHSLEDRIVKNMFRDAAKEGMLTVITKKPIVPTHAEAKKNPRARSAKLRAAEKI